MVCAPPALLQVPYVSKGWKTAQEQEIQNQLGRGKPRLSGLTIDILQRKRRLPTTNGTRVEQRVGVARQIEPDSNFKVKCGCDQCVYVRSSMDLYAPVCTKFTKYMVCTIFFSLLAPVYDVMCMRGASVYIHILTSETRPQFQELQVTSNWNSTY